MNAKKQRPIIGISIGDINGIGVEVTLRALSDNRVYKSFTPLIYGHGKVLTFYRKLMSLEDFNFTQIRSLDEIQHRKINVINVMEECPEVIPGVETHRALEQHFHERRKREGRSRVGVNVVGSGNTALMEIGFSPMAGWCLGSVCRGWSCAAHALFNMKKGRAWGASRNEPMVQMIDLSMIKYVGPEDRVVPKQEERQEYARKQKEEGEYKKWAI